VLRRTQLFTTSSRAFSILGERHVTRLVLTRKPGESVVLTPTKPGERIEVTVVSGARGRLKLAILAHESTHIVRRELLDDEGGLHHADDAA